MWRKKCTMECCHPSIQNFHGYKRSMIVFQRNKRSLWWNKMCKQRSDWMWSLVHQTVLSTLILWVSEDCIYKCSLNCCEYNASLRPLSADTASEWWGRQEDGRHKQREAVASIRSHSVSTTALHLFHFLSHSVLAVETMGLVIGRDGDNGRFWLLLL